MLLPAAGCGRRVDNRVKPRSPIAQVLSQQPRPIIPGVKDVKACNQACDDVDMGRPVQQPDNADYVQCYKECE